MVMMGIKGLELHSDQDSDPSPTTYSLRNLRQLASLSLSFLIRKIGTISLVTFLAQNLAPDAQWPLCRRAVVTTALVTRA